MNIENSELLNIKGGALKGYSYGIFIGIAGLISLVAGIINGYLNPSKCN